ncbi:MAG: AmmeMemoRadiSam system protein B [Armatimonadetes bacterium]|nr:AmmeMemoRadiSam system protein B [Armatimonadota bacterium]
MARKPAVAGMFYESTRDQLIERIEQRFLGPLGPGKLPQTRKERLGRIIGLVSPHAGYIYSGSAAAWAYTALANDGIPDTIVILGPNHYGLGEAVAISSEQTWETPLGALETDTEIAAQIINTCKFASANNQAHQKEHSIEVQLPFIQYIGADKVKIVPICVAHLNETEALLLTQDLGSAIATALKGKSAAIIASTDFSHYVSKSRAESLDSLAIEQILNLDPQGLLRTVYSKNITMCGAIGTAVMLEAAKHLGATQAHKLTYCSSGDVSGDFEEVVGYAALSIGK